MGKENWSNEEIPFEFAPKPTNDDVMEFIKLTVVVKLRPSNGKMSTLESGMKPADAHLYRVFQFAATWVSQLDTNFSQVRRCHRDR